MKRNLNRSILLAAAMCALPALALADAMDSVPRGEIIPSLGLTKPRHQMNDAKLYGGVAFRGSFSDVLKGEIGVMYRTEDINNSALTLRQWPVSASVWVQPVPMLYAGGGVGWYMTTLDYSVASGHKDDTRQDFGVHVGGGLRVPLARTVNLDLNGRYVFMNDIHTEFADLDRLDPDFWTLSMGLAIGF